MNDAHFKLAPWQHFKEFISLSADRFGLLKNILKGLNLEFTVLEITGNRHFVLAPPPPEEAYLRRPPVILVAHYDRVKGSPGANDNSAGVFILLETALKLKKDNAKNWIIIFTDKEELKPGESVQTQGSYTLAAGFKSLRMEKAKIFCFDACGAGDTLIVSSTLEYLLKKETGRTEKFKESLMEHRSFALNTAQDLRMKKILLAPTPFSDDLGFFRAGLAAQTITVLPSSECILLVSELRKNPEFADTLISAEHRRGSSPKSIPVTWRYINTPADSYLRLTPQHYRTLVKFAEALCKA
jgi:hypothetical protein